MGELSILPTLSSTKLNEHTQQLQ